MSRVIKADNIDKEVTPELRDNQHLFIDRYGNWAVIESWHGTFNELVQVFIDYRKEQGAHTNPNSIATYQRGSASKDTAEHRFRQALQDILKIQNQTDGYDWVEIDQARQISKLALGINTEAEEGEGRHD